MFTQTRPLLRSCIVCTHGLPFCHAGGVRLSQNCQYASLNINSLYAAMRGCNLAVPSEPLPARVAGSELRDLLGRTMSVLQLRLLFCPAHGSVPAVLQRKAPLPPLCIMTNQGRQAAVPLAHHSTVSLPRENKLAELHSTPLRTRCCTYGTKCQHPIVNQVTDLRG